MESERPSIDPEKLAMMDREMENIPDIPIVKPKAGSESLEVYLERIDEDEEYLCYSMREEMKRLVKHLVEMEVLDDEQKEDILDEVSDFLKARVCLEHLLKKNDKEALTKFYEASIQSHMWTVADILEPGLGPHKPENEDDIEAFLPDNWPTESHFETMRNPQAINVIKISARHKSMLTKYEKSLKSDSDMYIMDKKVRGCAVIIVNDTFKNSKVFPKRKGTEYDCRGLDHIFSQFGFEVEIAMNKTKRQIFDLLGKELKRDHKLYNCFVFVILSYGSDGKYVFGTDHKDKNNMQEALDVEQIKEVLSRIPDLAKKPKVVLIDAQPIPTEFDRLKLHQRSKGHPDHPMASLIGLKESLSYRQDIDIKIPKIRNISSSLSGIANISGDPDFGSIMRPEEREDGIDFDGIDFDGPADTITAPFKSDIYTAIANTPERLENENGDVFGSWFIQGFVFVAATYGFQMHLSTMLERVNTLCNSAGVSLVCSPVSTMDKTLYFFPGLPPDN